MVCTSVPCLPTVCITVCMGDSTSVQCLPTVFVSELSYVAQALWRQPFGSTHIWKKVVLAVSTSIIPRLASRGSIPGGRK